MVIGNKRCETCKHFFRAPPGAPGHECHRYPPQTTAVFIGMTANGQPKFHLDVRFGITSPEFVCGEYCPAILQAGAIEHVDRTAPGHTNGR